MSDTPSPNAALEAILLRYNLSPVSFHELRPDSYERCLAAHSLEQLELFYALLLEPDLTNQERAAQAPFWPKGTERAGELPSEYVVRMVRQRMFKERSLNDLSQVSDFIDRMKEKAGVQTAGNQMDVLDTLLNLMGEELLIAKLDGEEVKKNKDIAELLLSARSAKDRAATENAKLDLKKLDAARKGEELKLSQQKFQRETCELFLKWYKSQRALEIANSSVGNAEKIEQLRQTFFADVDALEKTGSVKLPPLK